MLNSTGGAAQLPDMSGYFCGMNLTLWRERTHADAHTRVVTGGGSGEYSPPQVLAAARRLIWAGVEAG